MPRFRPALLNVLALATVAGTVAGALAGPAGATSSGAGGGGGLSGYRWDPCQAITYRVNAQGGYAGALADIREAFAEIGRASGITFVYEGPTGRVAFVTGRDPRSDITVSWARPRQVSKLAGPVAGMANTSYVYHHGTRENVRGLIVFDASQPLRPGFASRGRPTWGQAFLHEIGHVIGLSHVRQRSEVMNPLIGRHNHGLGPGDRWRLVLLGRASGCVRDSLR